MRQMKDSGIEWIGEIPEGWEVVRIKYLCDLYTGNSIKDEDKNKFQDPVAAHPYIATKDIDLQFNVANYNNGLYIKNDNTSFKIAEVGSTLMCIEGGSAGKKKTYILQTVSFVNKLCCFAPKTINSRFIYYFILSPHYEKQFKTSLNGLIGGVSLSILRNFSVSFPNKIIQQHIADFLDDKCGKIDRYIEKQQQIIEKLKAYKQSVITEAVTKGLNPGASMKDSGVKWIGMIPEEWRVTTLKYLIHYIESGVSVNAGQEEAKNGEYGVLKTSSVSKYIFDIHENKSVNFDEMDRVKCPVRANTIIVSRMNTPELVGACAYVEQSNDTIFLPDRLWQVHFISKIHVKYIWYFLSSNIIRFYYASLSTGTSSSMQNISKSQFNHALVLLPEEKNQELIVQYLDKITFQVDKTIQRKQLLIDKLTAYKKSLIYEAVTGKLEVALPQPSNVDSPAKNHKPLGDILGFPNSGTEKVLQACPPQQLEQERRLP